MSFDQLEGEGGNETHERGNILRGYILQQQVEVSRRQMEYNFESEREMGVETKTRFKSISMIGKGSGIKGRKTSRTAEFLLCGTEDQT